MLKEKFEATVKKLGFKDVEVMVLGSYIHFNNLGKNQAERLQKILAQSGYSTTCFESKVGNKPFWKVAAKPRSC